LCLYIATKKLKKRKKFYNGNLILASKIFNKIFKNDERLARKLLKTGEIREQGSKEVRGEQIDLLP